MKTKKTIYSGISKVVKAVVDKSIKLDANSTTCMIVYQPKAPSALKKFSKVDNDK